MIRAALAAALFATGFSTVHAAPQMPSWEAPLRESAPVTFRSTQLAAGLVVELSAPLEKAASTSESQPGGRLRVGSARSLAKSARVDQWNAWGDGYVTRVDASSAGAEGLRVKLDVSALTQAVEVRAQGADGRIELMIVEPGRATEAWTPWTEGAFQTIELFSRTPQVISVGAVVHFDVSPYAKAAGTCTVPTSCSTNDPALDTAIAQRKKSVMRINFVEGGSSFVCSATLINTPRAPAGYVLTANHCIDNATSANSVTSLWFYEHTSCDLATGINPAQTQISGGMQLVFANHNVDSTLLLMNSSPPAGAVYAGWNAALMAQGTAVTSLSHPKGDTQRLAQGSVSQFFRVVGRPQDMYGVRFTRGIIEGGSSGSGVFTLSGGALELRGVLSGTTIRQAGGMSCTNLSEDALYGRFEILYPQIEQFIGGTPRAADDAPNRHFDSAVAASDAPLNSRAGTAASLNSRRLDYAGDIDIYRFVLTAPAVVSAWTEGPNIDSIGNILDSNGVSVEAEDDVQAGDNHFGITRHLQAGTYYVQVGHFEARETGTYNLRVRADEVDETNHTSLWWNPGETGWGLNVNHQGNKIFATLFTYENGQPVWFVMSDGQRQADGTYQGELYRGRGPAFNAAFTGVSVNSVGTMRVSFQGANGAAVAYTLNGVSVSRNLVRQQFDTVPVCRWSAFDRSYADNYQDLWYNPSESGWGVNITHQGSTVFATLFIYDANGNPLWLVMSNGVQSGNQFSGALYRTSGPNFNSSPWVAPATAQVGQMTFTPDTDNASMATLVYTFNGANVTKRIQRQVFGSLKPLCE